MAGTALVAATMFIAGGAVAAEKKMMKPSISVNGYFEAIVGGILDEDLKVNESDTSALDTRVDAEIYFNGRATLDNGLKIHAHCIQLEGMDPPCQRELRGRRPDRRVLDFGVGLVRQDHPRWHRRCTGEDADRAQRVLGRPASARRSTSTMAGSRAPMLAPCTTICSTRGWTRATMKRSPTSPRNSAASKSA